MTKFIIIRENGRCIPLKVRVEKQENGIHRCISESGDVHFRNNCMISDTYKEATKSIEEMNYITWYKNSKKKDNGNWDCKYCGREINKWDELSVDHIVPRSKGGKTKDSNLMICCKRCNRTKDSTDIKEFKKIQKKRDMKKIRNKPKTGKICSYAGVKLKDQLETVARMDSPVISLNAIKKECLVDRVLREYNEKRGKC